jgi:hypothetical protein
MKMRAYVLAVLLLVGCVKTGSPAVVPPLPDAQAQQVSKDLARAQMVLVSVQAASGVVCQLAGSSTNVCLTLTHALDIVAFSLQHARDLFDQFQRGGLDIAVVEQAVQAVFDGLDQFGGASQLARGMVTDGTNHPVAMPYCTRCCGVVVDPAEKASKAARPSCKPLPAAKAP